MPDEIDALLGDIEPATKANANAEKTDDGQSEYLPDGSRRRVDGLAHRPTMTREAAKRRHRRIIREAAATTQIRGLPGPGEDLVMILTGDWHGWDVIGAILDLAAPATIQSLHIATLGFNRTQGRHLADLLDDGQIGTVTMVVSEIFTEKNRGEYGTIHELLVTARGQTIASTRNHCKLLCLHMSDGRKFAIHGSLNLRRCNAFEQMVISHDAALHDFFVDYIREIAHPRKD